MITKGIVTEIVDTYFVKVRLPVYDRVSQASIFVATDELNTATVCTISNCRPNLRVGDIVFVGFEDNDMCKPIILGCLYGDGVTSSLADITANSLSVAVNTILSEDTTIGETKPTDIKNLANTSGNLQQQIDLLNSVIKNLQQQIDALDSRVTYLEQHQVQDYDGTVE